jgi:hypothetical protein
MRWLAGGSHHGDQSCAARRSTQAFHGRLFEARIEQPEIESLFGGFTGLGEIPTGRDTAAMRANLFAVGHHFDLRNWSVNGGGNATANNAIVRE